MPINYDFVPYLASASIKTWLVRAFVGDPRLTIGSGPSGWATARVGALARVEASGAVLARLVVGAVVEVLVAEQTAPALVAVALVGLLAGPVFAAGVADAFVAVATSPSSAASRRQRTRY